MLRPFIPDARRGDQDRDARECDVEGSPFFRIEAKHWKRIGWADVRRWCEKMVEDGLQNNDSRIPIGVAKVDRQRDWVVFAPLSSFMRIHEILYGDQSEDAEVHEL
jgi:hypothetical protein